MPSAIQLINVLIPLDEEQVLLKMLFTQNIIRIQFEPNIIYSVINEQQKTERIKLSHRIFNLSLSSPQQPRHHCYLVSTKAYVPGAFGKVYLIEQEYQLLPDSCFQIHSASFVIKVQDVKYRPPELRPKYRLFIEEEYLCTKNIPYLNAQTPIQIDNKYYCFMERVEGDDFFDVLALDERRKNLSMAQRLALLLELLECNVSR